MKREPRDAAHRYLSAALVGGIGVVTGAVHTYHFITDSPNSLLATISGIVLPLCLSLAMAGSGWWLVRSNITDKQVTRIVSWSTMGAVVFIISGLLIIQYQQAQGVMMSDRVFILIDSATGGMAIGFVFGLYATRIKRRTLQLDRYQRRLEQERDRFVALLDNLPDPVIQYEHVDGTPIIRAVNPAFDRVFDADGATVDGIQISEVVVPPNQERAAIDLDTDLHSDKTLQHEIRLKTSAGIRDFQLIVIPPAVATTDGTGHIIATDVTENKQHVRRLEVLNRVLRHDLRNHAGVIIGNADLLIDKLSKTTRAETIRDTANKLVELGDTVQQIEHALDRNNETTETVSLSEVLDECVRRARNEYPEADIKTEVPANENTAVCANDQIGLVFDNVIENAIEHNDATTPTVTITITSTHTFATVEIADNGPGLPDRERQVLQEGTETQLKHSLGLGLWLISWIVVDSGGDVTFEDNDPHGSIVSIDLPKADSKTAETVNKRSASSTRFVSE